MIDRHLGRVAFLVAGCFFMENLDGTIVVTAIPSISHALGGVITTYAGWEFLFLINIPLGVIAFAAAHRLVLGRPAEHVPPLDRLGVALTCSGLGALTYTAHLVSDRTPDWAAATAVGVA